MGSYCIALNAKDFDKAAFLQYIGNFVGIAPNFTPFPDDCSHSFQLWGPKAEQERTPPLLHIGDQGIQLCLHHCLDNALMHGAKAANWMLKHYDCHGFTIDDDFPAQQCNHQQLMSWMEKNGLTSPYLSTEEATFHLSRNLRGSLFNGIEIGRYQIVLQFSRYHHTPLQYRLRFEENFLCIGQHPVITPDCKFVNFDNLYQHLMDAVVDKIWVNESNTLHIAWQHKTAPWRIAVSENHEMSMGEELWHLSLADNKQKTEEFFAFYGRGVFHRRI